MRTETPFQNVAEDSTHPGTPPRRVAALSVDAGRSFQCETGHMPDAEDDDLAEMLPDGQWHVTVCRHCGARIEHTTTNPAYVEIAEDLHVLGHCP